MVNCLLISGLGNIMFQVATMESLAKDHNLKINYINANTHLLEISTLNRTKTYNSLEYRQIFENFKWNCESDIHIVKRVDIPYMYKDFIPENDVLYVGYFQSEKYFKHNRQFILDLFKPSNFVLDKLKKYDYLFEGKTLSIHVRRGDYLQDKDVHFVQSLDYFEKALAVMLSYVHYFDKILVFSDDIEWCKDNFNNSDFFNNKNLVFIENEKDYVELFLMSKCTHNIISNSSFSWWGAWLGNENKVVIAPEKWWAGYYADVIPENWIKI